MKQNEDAQGYIGSVFPLGEGAWSITNPRNGKRLWLNSQSERIAQSKIDLAPLPVLYRPCFRALDSSRVRLMFKQSQQT